MMSRLKVMLVDDHEIVRQGLRALIDAEDDMEVVVEASSGRQAASYAKIDIPDIVVMDVRMPDGNGVEACREIRADNPDIKVIMLTSFSDDGALFNSIMAGAAGYILKQIRGTDLVEGIRNVGAGGSLLEAGAATRVLERLRRTHVDETDPKLSRLSGQEERIVEMIAKGMTNRQIGEEMHLSDKTVKNYVSSLLHKLEVSRRSEAAAYIARVKTNQATRDDQL